jgi:hypothetical protein
VCLGTLSERSTAALAGGSSGTETHVFTGAKRCLLYWECERVVLKSGTRVTSADETREMTIHLKVLLPCAKGFRSPIHRGGGIFVIPFRPQADRILSIRLHSFRMESIRVGSFPFNLHLVEIRKKNPPRRLGCYCAGFSSSMRVSRRNRQFPKILVISLIKQRTLLIGSPASNEHFVLQSGGERGGDPQLCVVGK